MCAGLATSAWAGDADPGLDRLWRLDPSARPPELQRDAPAEAREVVTLEEAVGLALQANQLARSPERQRFIAETVKQAYAGAFEAGRALATQQERLKEARGAERAVATLADRGAASPGDVLRARAEVARSAQDVQEARTGLALQLQQLNRLMGRDPQARLRVREEPTASAVATFPTAPGTTVPSGD